MKQLLRTLSDTTCTFVRDDAALEDNLWSPQTERDIVRITTVIGATALAAYAANLRIQTLRHALPLGVIAGKVAILILVTLSLVWMPRVLRARHNPRYPALFWAVITLLSAALDSRAGGDLIDLMWSLIPGYLSIAAVGFFAPSLHQVAWLVGYCVATTPIVWLQPRGLEFQIGLLGMVLSMGSYMGVLYRQSVRTMRDNEQLIHQRLLNIARVLPEPIAAALRSEEDLERLMRPQLRHVIVVSIDVRGSTPLLQRLGALGYLETVQPMVTHLFQYARRLEAFAKFEGDGLLVVFGAFSDRPIDEDQLDTVIGFLLLAQKAVAELNLQQGHRLTQQLCIGLGIASGEILAGSVAGGEELMFDVVGEPIAYACRLEAASKTLAVVDGHATRNVAVITDALAQLLGDRVPARPIHATRVVRDFESRERAWEIDLMLLAQETARGLRRQPSSQVMSLDLAQAG